MYIFASGDLDGIGKSGCACFMSRCLRGRNAVVCFCRRARDSNILKCTVFHFVVRNLLDRVLIFVSATPQWVVVCRGSPPRGLAMKGFSKETQRITAAAKTTQDAGIDARNGQRDGRMLMTF